MIQAKILLILLLPLLAFSCFEEDERVPPYPGQVAIVDKNIETFTSYFDLETAVIIKSDSSNLWQLGFECGTNGWHIIVNSGAGWFLYNTRQTDISSVSFPTGVAGMYDIQSTYPDSTAAGNWLSDHTNGSSSKKEVYLIGKQIGINYIDVRKIVFNSVNMNSYQFYYTDIESGFSDTVTITKTDTSNFVYYSFLKRKQLNTEPTKTSYDLVFCPYYDLATLFGQTIPYLVRGVLINISGTTAVIDSITNYNDIDSSMVAGYQFSLQRDAIGYKWKDVVVDPGSGSSAYTVNLNYSYLIHTSSGNYYKLRFIDYMFGNTSGFPQFEYKLLGKD